MPRYRYNADLGKAIPVETDEEKAEREDREHKERVEKEWEEYVKAREARKTGPYL